MKKVHFIAIGGSGMSGIAKVLLSKGVQVSGSDVKSSSATKHLRKLGADVFIGHRKENIKNPDIVVVSSAISNDNPEVIEAKNKNLPIIHRMDMLLKAIEGKKILSVAGAHGKTTTAAMVSWILEQVGKDPTYLIGGSFGVNGNARVGDGDLAVIETDESDGSFLKCNPDISVVTNIDNDHLEYWNDFETLKRAFSSYLKQTKNGGMNIVCTDNPYLNQWAADNPDATTYGVKTDAIWQAVEIERCGWKTTCKVCKHKRYIAPLNIEMPGLHNLQNALGAVAASTVAGVDPVTACEQLSIFPGVKRRLERIGRFGRVLLLDDFAHHPNEISTALSAIKEHLPNEKIVVLFQPHRYSRTRLLKDEFGSAFSKADAVVVTGIYGGPGEKDDLEIEPGIVSNAIEKSGHKQVFKAENFKEATRLSVELCMGRGVLVTLGAGDIWKTHDMLSDLLAT